MVLLTRVVIFLIIRATVVPGSFGQYGHYRAAALDAIAARPIARCEWEFPACPSTRDIREKSGSL